MRTETERAKGQRWPIDPETERNVYDVPTFCRRNSISVTTAYRLQREGKLTIGKILGKAVVTAEEEVAFRKLLRDGKLAEPNRRPKRKASAA
jgi:hypothetical protein